MSHPSLHRPNQQNNSRDPGVAHTYTHLFKRKCVYTMNIHSSEHANSDIADKWAVYMPTYQPLRLQERARMEVYIIVHICTHYVHKISHPVKWRVPTINLTHTHTPGDSGPDLPSALGGTNGAILVLGNQGER